MVRKLQKEKKGVEALEELEKESEKEVAKFDDIRKQEFKDEMCSGYFFSVVFDTNKERDDWLDKMGLKPVEDFFIRIEDLERAIKP